MAAGFLPLSLATLETRIPTGRDWVHEPKLDGYRMEAVLRPANTPPRVTLYSRNAKDWTARFPEVVAALAALPVAGAVLDGEIVARTRRGESAFQTLQRSLENGRTSRVQYHLFDVLTIDDVDLRPHPLQDRIHALRLLLQPRLPHSPLHMVQRLAPRSGDVLAAACHRGLEGVVSKRVDAAYASGRHRNWVKVKCIREQEFVVVGFTAPRGSRVALGALVLGYYDGARLQFAGKVGTGFDDATLQRLIAQLTPLAQSTAPSAPHPLLPTRDVVWVRPRLVAQVAFTEWTADGVLRHPVFRGLREDKPARDVRREG